MVPMSTCFTMDTATRTAAMPTWFDATRSATRRPSANEGEPNSTDRRRHHAIPKPGNQWATLRDRILHGRKLQRRLMTCLAHPYLGDPDGVRVGVIPCDNVAQATGHIFRAGEQNVDQLVACARARYDLADQSVHLTFLRRFRLIRSDGADDGRRRTHPHEFASFHVDLPVAAIRSNPAPAVHRILLFTFCSRALRRSPCMRGESRR